MGKQKSKIQEWVKAEMDKQISRNIRSAVLTENVRNLYEATKLVRDFEKVKSPKLKKAKLALKLAESKLNEFFEDEWETEYGDFGEDSEFVEVDNSPLFDSLICVMECSRDLYNSIDLDAPVDSDVVSKIQQAEALMRTACEMYKLSAEENFETENEELSDDYIGDGEYDSDDFDDDDCLDCEDEEDDY